jgi:hypothetical protein
MATSITPTTIQGGIPTIRPNRNPASSTTSTAQPMASAARSIGAFVGGAAGVSRRPRKATRHPT